MRNRTWAFVMLLASTIFLIWVVTRGERPEIFYAAVATAYGAVAVGLAINGSRTRAQDRLRDAHDSARTIELLASIDARLARIEAQREADDGEKRDGL